MTFVSRDRALLRGEHGQKEPGALFVELRLAMRGVARNGNDDDEDEDDDDDDEETLLSIKMANYPTNKRRSSGTKRERAVGRRSRLTPLAPLRPPKEIS